MMTIEKLRLFKAEFEKVQELGDYLPIGLFVFIQDNEILKKEFDYRLHYFKNLANDKEFLSIQDKLCEKTIALIKSIDNDKVEELQIKLNRKYKNYFKNDQTEITFTELRQLALNESNYYRLDKGVLQNYAGRAYQVKKQYESIANFLNSFYSNIPKDKKIRLEFGKSICDYNDVLSELNQKIDWLPIRLNVKTFTDFWKLCGSLVSDEIKSEIKLNDSEKVKQVCGMVIDDLIDSLATYKELDIQNPFFSENTSFYSIIEALGDEQKRTETTKEAIEGEKGLEAERTPEDDGWRYYRTESGLKLGFNGLSGAFKYEKRDGSWVNGCFAPKTQEYIVFQILLESVIHLAQYKTLLKALYGKDFPNPLKTYQPDVWCLQGVVKKIKHGLGILPKNEKSSENIFETQKKNKAYRLKLID